MVVANCPGFGNVHIDGARGVRFVLFAVDHPVAICDDPVTVSRPEGHFLSGGSSSWTVSRFL